MKKLIKLFVICLLFLLCCTSVEADNKNTVNLYLFYSNACKHCEKEREYLQELKNKYSNLNIYEYEISDTETIQMLNKLENELGFTTRGVPTTIIGEKVISGFKVGSTDNTIKLTIDFYSNHGYQDRVGEVIGNKNLPTYKITEESLDEYIRSYEEKKVNVPLVGEVDLLKYALPVVTIIMGLIDGFNPCAMWVLLFLISMLLGMKNKKRMWSLGFAFLITSAFVYFLFMIAWLNVASFLTSITWFRLLIALIALVGGSINLRGYFKKKKDDGCDIVDEKKRTKIFTRIKNFTSEKSFILALLGIMALAVSVNFVELVCSAGLPIMYVEILSLNNVIGSARIMYILLYILFFLIDDIIIFTIAMISMELTGFSTKYGKIAKLVGGIILIIIGILMIFKPEWLMFNF